VFILLAGLSAYLVRERGRSTGEVSWFLLTRGLWLIVLEFTLVRLGWSFDVTPGLFVAQVIWVLGASMVVLAGLIHLPIAGVAVIAVVMIAGHNLLDAVQAENFGAAAWMWSLLHQPKLFRLGPETSFLALYSLIPWVGVMAAGNALGPLFSLDRATRIRWLVVLGAVTLVGFIAIRAANVYGDPAPWSEQASWLSTVLSFLNCEKYPPSLVYLLMTLGPALLLLAAFEREHGRWADWIIAFGRSRPDRKARAPRRRDGGRRATSSPTPPSRCCWPSERGSGFRSSTCAYAWGMAQGLTGCMARAGPVLVGGIAVSRIRESGLTGAPSPRSAGPHGLRFL
jgi:uncharacterized membrane protein